MFKTIRYLILVLLIFQSLPGAYPEPSDSLQKNIHERNKRLAVGISLLSMEYIGGPLLAQKVWWQHGFRWGNPFDYVGENEPFLEDDAWHLAANNIFTEFHYQILKGCFNFKYATPAACVLTFVTWTGIESLDALDLSGGWKFSWNDEKANCLGIGFWLLKHYYPQTPIDVRIGMQKWGELFNYFKKGLVALDDYEQYQQEHSDNYGKLKVEAIYRFYKEFYGGISISKHPGTSQENLWGFCIGYDFLKKLNGKRNGWWNEPVNYLSRYTAMTLGFTYWPDDK